MINCPKCDNPIPDDDVNVAHDVAYCRRCQTATTLSTLIHSGAGDGVLPPVPGPLDDEAIRLDCPPPGAWYRKNMFDVEMGATHRSMKNVLVGLFFILFWNGVTSIFFCLFGVLTLRYFNVEVPEWFPNPDLKSKDGKELSLGMVIFFWVFLTPFILVGLGLVAAWIVMVFGRVEIKIRAGVGEIFTGIGFLGRTRRFVPSLVRTLKVGKEAPRYRWGMNSRGGREEVISISQVNGESIEFASMLTRPRRLFLAKALKETCLKK